MYFVYEINQLHYSFIPMFSNKIHTKFDVFHKNRDILWTFCFEKYDEFLNGINHQHLDKEHIYLSLQRIYRTSMWMISMFADK